MELALYRDHNAHCALEVGRGSKLIKYVALTEVGPRIHQARITEFDSDFRVIEGYDPRKAALQFLGAAKRAFEHDDEVLSILLEIIMGKPVSEMTVAELALAYNDVAKSIGAKPRKSFKSKAEGLAVLEALDKKAKTSSPMQAKQAEKKVEKAEKVRAAKPKGEAKERKPKGPGVGSFCLEQIANGKTNDQILVMVAKKFPDAKTNNACVAYYRHKAKAAA